MGVGNRQSARDERTPSIKYDSAIHAKRVESTLRSLETKAKVYYLRIPRSAVFALVLALLLPWVVVIAAYSLRARSSQGPGDSVAAVTPPHRADKRFCKPGPWGAIEYFDIVTRPPDELISSNFFAEPTPPWLFKGYTREALDELLMSVGLTQEQRSTIDRSVEFSPAANLCVAKPGKELILGLSPEARSHIYAVLGKFPENPGQHDPFIFKVEQIYDWLHNAGLQPSTVALVKGLLYPHGEFMLLSDCNTVMSQLPDAGERVRLLKVLFRRRAVFPKLRVSSASDIPALCNYWGKGGREVVVRPLLESIPPTQNGIMVDVSLLLPVFARERVYTYPLPGPAQQGFARDCHWTALNFFNELPDDRLGRADTIAPTLEKDYYPVPGSPAFGDVALFFTPEHAIIHSAVYVADDILFTKNGPHFTSPWLFETLDEVRAAFPAYEKLDVNYFRLKKL